MLNVSFFPLFFSLLFYSRDYMSRVTAARHGGQIVQWLCFVLVSGAMCSNPVCLSACFSTQRKSTLMPE